MFECLETHGISNVKLAMLRVLPRICK